MKLKTIILIGLLMAVAMTIVVVLVYPFLFDLPMSPLAQGSWFNWIAGCFVAACVAEIFGFLIFGVIIYAIAFIAHKRLNK